MQPRCAVERGRKLCQSASSFRDARASPGLTRRSARVSSIEELRENQSRAHKSTPSTPNNTMASKRALRALHPRTPPCCPQRPSPLSLPQAQSRPQSTTSSTSALAYKALHRRTLPSLPTTTAPVSPAAAVSNILYETPLPSRLPPKRHILNCLVQNEPGVLSRISGILAARGFNIDSLVVCSTEVADLSRMTIVLQGQDGVVEQARRQLEDLVPVWAVLDYTAAPLVQRELLLAKISILGPEYFEQVLAHHREMTDLDEHSPSQTSTATPPADLTPDQLADWQESQSQLQGEEEEQYTEPDFHPSNLAPSEALRLKHQHLETITYLTHQFGGKVLDISTNNCVVEVSAKPVRIDSFMKLIAPFGILESARTGKSLYHAGLCDVDWKFGADLFWCRFDGSPPLPVTGSTPDAGEGGRGRGGHGCFAAFISAPASGV